MRKILPLICILGLTACASPAANMTPEQVAQLSNNQLCQLQSSYPWEVQTETEIGKRNLNCDPAYNKCLSQGIESNSPQMGFCIEQTRDNWALQQQVKAQKQQTEAERRSLESQNRLQQAVENSRYESRLDQYERLRRIDSQY